MRALKPILRQFVIFAVVFAVMDSACGGERVTGAYLNRRLPLVVGLSVALGLYEYRRTRQARETRPPEARPPEAHTLH